MNSDETNYSPERLAIIKEGSTTITLDGFTEEHLNCLMDNPQAIQQILGEIAAGGNVGIVINASHGFIRNVSPQRRYDYEPIF